MHAILVINPGSTSTKIGMFQDLSEVFTETVSHSAEEISRFASIADQYEIPGTAHPRGPEEKGFRRSPRFARWSAGEGSSRPIPGGVYRVTEPLLEDLRSAKFGEHASNLGALIAHALGSRVGRPVLHRRSRGGGRALRRRAGLGPRALRAPQHLPRPEPEGRLPALTPGNPAGATRTLTLIVAHMGGGVVRGPPPRRPSRGREPGPERGRPVQPGALGTLPAGDLAKLCFSGKHSEKEVLRMINGAGRHGEPHGDERHAGGREGRPGGGPQGRPLSTEPSYTM
ncbi:MAG: hypothetical protein M0C28_41600 [Candidatus Moduliflexus flocculans]|nr:hypothetical protein [Candidatus Moduliflexus flocculans]